jgi:dTDP-L-rhamnose 4-epimerase
LSVRTLVTGGAGFIGSHLVPRLLEHGDDVIVLDSLEEQVHDGKVYEPPEGVKFVQGSVGDEQALDTALDRIDRVVHLAAAVGVGQSMYEIARYVDVNTLATARFLERLVKMPRRPSRLVVASSMSIYGEGEYECAVHGPTAPPPRPESQLADRRWECLCPRCGLELTPVATREAKPLIPTSVYAITKRDHEELCLVTGAAYGISSLALRFFNVYGSGQALSNPYTGVAAIFSSRLLNDRPPLVFEDGRQSRDFIHVEDIASGILRALEAEEVLGRAVNLGTGRSVTINDVATLLSAQLEKGIEPLYPQQYRAGDVRHCFANVELARELLGWQATARLEDGVGELVRWVQSQTAADHVDVATQELAARGLAR